MRPVLLWIAAGLFTTAWFAPSRASADEFRTLTNTEGRTIRAKVLKVEGSAASVQLEDGRGFDIPLASLSQADRESLEQWAKDSPSTPATNDGGISAEAVNAAIGHKLFADGQLWDSDPGEAADRLSWRRESKTELSESYRSYPREDYRFLGARPYSAALYGEEGRITSLSVVFANKGDSYASAGEGEQHFIQGKPVPGGMEGVKALMKHDAETISKALTGLLGEPNRQKFGEGESRVAVERWDWNGHAFLLSHVDGEYVSLAVEPTAFADARGRSARVPDSTVRERIRKFVERRDNGDVVITNIPMVNQGPKGYCVPATAERCMRFLGIPADMYLLAMAGETKAGGGTSVDLLLSNIGRDIKRKGRSFDIKSGELKMRDIKRSIDGGVPMIWAMYSTDGFNETANARKEARADGSWDSYKSQVAAAAASPGLSPDTSTAHVVIIMGYNEATNEIAFSDSWGERYLERWITLPEAEQVSQKRFYVIDL
ncbi:MAG TPA: C39 family peptidase [Bacteroidia bacterium]|nr:C39 family peptidase [Bacteroidia bacterium]